MQENLYQNIDISQNNPLDTGETQNLTPVPPVTKKLNSKIILLIILGVIIVLLFIISQSITSLRQTNSTLKTSQVTPLPTEIPLPTSSSSLIPEIYQDKFKTIENNLQNDLNLEVPPIDTEVGL